MRFGAIFFFACFSTLAVNAQDTNSTPAPAAPGPKPATYTQVRVDQPYIAMTFDDGPSAALTPRLLDILKQRNIKATFFLIGQNAAANPDIVRRILADGHEIGNHSWTHPQLSKLSDDGVTTEISKTQDAIKEASGFTPTILRPPYGAITARQREWIESRFGLSIILWSVDPFDWKRPGASVITQRILSQVRPGAIILSHDIHKQTIDAMPATLDALAAKGYKFVTVTELIAMNKPKPSPTPVASTGQERPESVKSAKIKPVTGNFEAHIQPNGQEQNGRAVKPDPAAAGQ
ncbi:MAG: polysaccharide deacetylase family protein [Verrucomicrobia bacterium]|nr:polysaccharide deacetylase family protein [Verrucomicrobiota bacterium]